MCGCSGRSGGYINYADRPWRLDRPDGSPDYYKNKGEAEYMAQIVRGTVTWIGEGPEPEGK